MFDIVFKGRTSKKKKLKKQPMEHRIGKLEVKAREMDFEFTYYYITSAELTLALQMCHLMLQVCYRPK